MTGAAGGTEDFQRSVSVTCSSNVRLLLTPVRRPSPRHQPGHKCRVKALSAANACPRTRRMSCKRDPASAGVRAPSEVGIQGWPPPPPKVAGFYFPSQPFLTCF